MEIFTNVVDFYPDFDFFDNKYEILALHTTKKRFSFNDYILDPKCYLSEKDKNSIMSCLYSFDHDSYGNDKVVYFLRERKHHTSFPITKLIASSYGEARKTDLYIQTVTCSELESHILAQLMLNSIPHWDSEGFYAASNTTGRLLLFNTTKGANRRQVVTLELKISREMHLFAKVQTFTSVKALVKAKNHDRIFARNHINSYPQFELNGNNNTLTRVPPDRRLDLSAGKNSFVENAENVYIGRQFPSSKNNVSFLNPNTLESLGKSKLSNIFSAIELLNDKFEDVLAEKFVFQKGELDVTQGQIIAEKEDFRQTTRRNTLSKIVGDSPIQIICADNEPVSINMANTMSEMLLHEIGKKRNKKELFTNVSVCAPKDASPDAYNIVILQPRKYYASNKIPDPYMTIKFDFPVQHVTTDIGHDYFFSVNNENFEEKMEAASGTLSAIMMELVIKKCIYQKDFSSLSHLLKCDIPGPMSFFWGYQTRKKILENEKEKLIREQYVFRCDIKPDMTFEISHVGNVPENYQILSCFTENDLKGEYKTDYHVIDENGVWNKVSNTPLRLYGDYNKIADLLKEIEANKMKKKKGIPYDGLIGWRDTENRNIIGSHFPAFTNIHNFQMDGSQYYIVGKIGKGIQRTGFNNAPSIREVTTLPFGKMGENLFVRNPAFLYMMEIPILTVSGLGVMPFPVKLMREWAKMNFNEIREAMAEEIEDFSEDIEDIHE